MFKNIIPNFKLQKSWLKNEGTALLMTILILNSIILVSLAAASVIASGVKMSGTEAKSTKAYFAAEAGAEQVLWEYRKAGGSCQVGAENNCNFSKSLPNNSYYEEKYVSGDTNLGSVLIFISKGTFSGLSRSVELDFKF
jgi:hypothetical protein